MNWDQYFLKMAELVASKSKDRSTKVGVVIVGPDNEVVSTGFNGMPRGVIDDVNARHERPAKYMYTEHAERNALYNAARIGVKLKGCRMYLNVGPNPCADCSRGIIQSGIIEIIGYDIAFEGKGAQWDEETVVGKEMMLEAGVKIRHIVTM